jgi:hypothetical protein
MSNNKIGAAIVKRDSTQNWLKAKNYIPPLGTIVIMENEDGSQIIRFGNGKTMLHDLPNLKQENYSAPKSKYIEKEELLEL